jgi:hypothetical protein
MRRVDEAEGVLQLRSIIYSYMEPHSPMARPSVQTTTWKRSEA